MHGNDGGECSVPAAQCHHKLSSAPTLRFDAACCILLCFDTGKSICLQRARLGGQLMGPLPSSLFALKKKKKQQFLFFLLPEDLVTITTALTNPDGGRAEATAT